ncbi:hypothetical protein HMPREF0290_0198 [Corynebacterium efficiens YS-314]|uniref:Uncharacterized protein n=1 Tax=Corynebacterium efficiens (strain DSM 44549 / YS-314 / AJ 12310 / JCM 11189 / NBRC 100395) TaxID=196164 RepID=Q8FM39_COREF|nr:hypothetical protein HMPREF0290_0198 [Corynebacterium efficiens YS-314]BAC19478.1 hypothetical protein [Corynebacterium efficiens YS-314]
MAPGKPPDDPDVGPRLTLNGVEVEAGLPSRCSGGRWRGEEQRQGDAGVLPRSLPVSPPFE